MSQLNLMQQNLDGSPLSQAEKHYELFQQVKKSNIEKGKDYYSRKKKENGKKLLDRELALSNYYKCIDEKIKLTEEQYQKIDILVMHQMEFIQNFEGSFKTFVDNEVKDNQECYRCILCRSKPPIPKSHVISEFLHRKSSLTPKFQYGDKDGQNPNSAILCLPLLCLDCEKSISHYEGELAVILEYFSEDNSKFRFTKKLLLCVISLSFRVLFQKVDEKKETVTTIENYRKKLLSAKKDFKKFVLMM